MSLLTCRPVSGLGVCVRLAQGDVHWNGAVCPLSGWQESGDVAVVAGTGREVTSAPTGPLAPPSRSGVLG